MTDTKVRGGFTTEEQAAMKAAVKERKAAARRSGKATREEGEADLLAKIAEIPAPERAMAERLHALVMSAAPVLEPRTWYGMPAYARDGKVVCFFRPAVKFKERYATFGFQPDAHLDDGTMWATSFALTDLSADDEARIAELVRKSVR
jgi:uncharacterized protein YdhG (YjbR/CyaY superfamily)